jgi:putative PIN family toxin of toxin-antitoxin system
VTRAVFDCVILLQAAARRTGPAAECLQAVRDGRLKLFVSLDILAEVRDVLSRPKTLRKFPALTPEAVDVFLADVANHATTLGTVSKTFALARDPKDEPYIDLAAAIQARYLVSRDKDLLDLMDDDTFRQQFPGLVVIDPVALLRELTLGQPKPEPDQRPEDGERETGHEAG